MLYIFTALYCEAHILIQRLSLTKIAENTHFQEFYSGKYGVRLTVTGVGEIAAAAAVGSICTAHHPAEGDLLLNIGTCAHASGGTGIFLCNRIFEQATGRSFYPDMLYRHGFGEASVVTGMRLLDNSRDSRGPCLPDGMLYDMEAAAVYQAGAYFFGPHQMIFLKIVSDHGRAESVSAKQVERLMEEHGQPLFDFIRRLTELTDSSQQRDAYMAREAKLLEQLSLALHCSRAMRDSLKRHLHYLTLAGIDEAAVIQDLYKEGMLPCKDKREGKLCLEELKRRLF